MDVKFLSKTEKAQFEPKLHFKLILATLFLWTAGILVNYKFENTKPTPVIQTSDGPVQGSITYSRSGLEYWQFLGIPFAKPPTGHRKFLPTQPVCPWKNIKQTTKWPPSCAQFLAIATGKPDGQLDCLYLNVFVGSGNNPRKPVIVFVHPGAFQFGAGSEYQPDYFMDHDIVFITLNYRMGPYGFLNLEDPQGPNGNMGLSDLHTVLKWVQKNVANFKGDPDNVTVQGSSAGGVLVHLLILSPVTQGLIHKAVMQSGYATTSWGFCRRPRKRAYEYAKKLGCLVTNTSSVKHCFENTPWEKVVSQQLVFIDPFGDNDMFQPSIDGKFIPEFPEDTLASGKFPKIPVLFGVNAADGGVRSGVFDAAPDKLETLDKNWKQLLHKFLLYEAPLTSEVATGIRREYSVKFSENTESTMESLTKMSTGCGFYYPAHMAGYYHAKHGAPTYMYFYNYTSNIYISIYSLYSATRLNDWLPTEVRFVWTAVRDWIIERVFGYPGAHKYGAVHADDLLQDFNFYGLTKWFSGPDLEFSRDFVKAIVDFANGTETSRFRNINWPRVVVNTDKNLTDGHLVTPMPYMLMDNQEKPEVIQEPFFHLMKFWRWALVTSDKYI